jgi:hypothetical protein
MGKLKSQVRDNRPPSGLKPYIRADHFNGRGSVWESYRNLSPPIHTMGGAPLLMQEW